MTIAEFRKSKDYADMIAKIKGYRSGFQFTLDFVNIPKAKARALEVVTEDCKKMGILESVSFGLNLNGDVTEETFKRTNKA